MAFKTYQFIGTSFEAWQLQFLPIYV